MLIHQYLLNFHKYYEYENLIKNNCYEIFKYIFNLYTDIDVQKVYKMTMKLNNLDIIKYLMSKKNIINDDAFFTACMYGHIDIVKYFYSKEIGINLLNSAFLTAVARGHLEVIKYLHLKGADTNNIDFGLGLALAREEGHRDVVEYLESVRI